MTIRALIVDDEAPARDKIRRYLSADPDVVIVGEAADGISAAAAILDLAPDVVFLDVVMPAMDGFEVLRQLDASSLPHVVFITAHDDHAVRAFDVNALDYLLKPVDRERLQQTLTRLRTRRAGRREDLPSRLERALDTLAPPAPAHRLLVSGEGRTHVLDVAAIDWAEAAGNYTVLHVGKETHAVRQPLARVLARLDPARFARIHRSRFVNIDRVRELRPLSHGDAAVVLRDGTELTLSRRFRTGLWQRFRVEPNG